MFCVVSGGVPIATDRATLHHACHIAVGTPGRLLSLFQEKLLSSACLRRVVLDEVDQLLVPDINSPDSNARPDNVMDQMVRQVLALRTSDTQTIVCSATLPDDLLDSLQRLLKPNAQSVSLCVDTPSLKGVRQFLVDISDQLPQSSNVEHPTAAAIAAQKYATFATKSSTLVSLLSRIPFQQCVAFSNNRTRAGELVELLQASGWPARCVAGDMSQHERVDVLKALHLNQCRLLVSTDLIARGIDGLTFFQKFAPIFCG
jgi:ATP-dependent RNA helicase DDX20